MIINFLSRIEKWKGRTELWFILGVAAILRIVGITKIYPSIDELFGMNRVFTMFKGRDLNPHWFSYPTGDSYFLLGLLPFRFLGGVISDHWTHMSNLFYAYLQDPMVVAPLFRFAGIVVSLLAIYFVYLTADKLVGRRWAWLAGLFLAVSPFATNWSIQIWPEAIIILPAAICCYFAVLYTETGKLKHIIFSGLAVGIATSIKYNAVFLCVIIPCAVWVHVRLHQTPKPLQALGHIFSSGIAALAGFVLLTPFSVLDWHTFYQNFETIMTKYRAVSHIGRDAVYLLQTSAPWQWWSQALNNITPGFLWIIAIALIIAFIRWRKQYLLLIGPIIVMIPFFTWFGKAEFYHLIPILPIFGCVLSVAASNFYSFAKKYKFIPYLLVIAVLLPGLSNNIINLTHRTLPDTRIEARNWIEANIPDGSKILLDKLYVPYLVRTQENVEYLIKNKVSNIYFLSQQLNMPRKVSYWTENLPIEFDSSKYVFSTDGKIISPKLLTPTEYAAAGFKYVVLSSGTYQRFYNDPSYKPIMDYYQSFFKEAEIVYETKSGNSGPKITILKFKPSSPSK